MFDLLRNPENWEDLARRAVVAFERSANGQEPTPPTSKSPTTGSDYVPMTVETFDNHIYFYAKVDTDRCLDLIRRVREVDNELRTQHMSRALNQEFPAVPIWLHLQSGGGELFTGLNIADQLQGIQSPIYSVVEGVCASAATLISMACTRRFILPSSFMLIHQLSSHHWGKYSEFEDEKKLLDMLMDRLYEFYATNSKLKKKEIRALLERDTWFDAQQCLARGLVDEII